MEIFFLFRPSPPWGGGFLFFFFFFFFYFFSSPSKITTKLDVRNLAIEHKSTGFSQSTISTPHRVLIQLRCNIHPIGIISFKWVPASKWRSGKRLARYRCELLFSRTYPLAFNPFTKIRNMPYPLPPQWDKFLLRELNYPIMWVWDRSLLIGKLMGVIA